ncbi:DUF305 domain-containing protein [Primorskyibacter aestuariivivens]|uniref:DUF305 domain-containing protein n=1 Tax=Primorskyibacter aestuariivivens TaxID=1888912 RepID=UPI0023008FF8|nr:DUF305 domain-containing protein [Primorskyibacter aestuariivivens]MDA7429151.1 DUF305 domain-containing protein [Primorskyibacter aestuariivivens]
MSNTTQQNADVSREGSRTDRDTDTHRPGSAYGRFFAMVGTSTALMFGLMYLNTYAFEHIYWSETRFYMMFVMGATMAMVMLLFMWGMYRNVAANAAILLGSAVLFAGALWLVRSQETVQDESWMSAMIPHHSIAIMTSERAEVTDPRVAALAKEIVHAQNREIAEMRFLLADIAANGEAGPDWPLGKTEGPTPIESLSQAISTPVIAGIRPAPLSEEEITRVLGADPACTFVRAVNADPVLATDGSGNGVAKVSGALVTFQADGGVSNGGVMSGDGGRLTVSPGEGNDGEDATLLFELTSEPALAVGFMGYWNCAA